MTAFIGALTDYIREAGWPVYPILVLGFAALAVSVRHAVVPQRSLQPLAVWLSAATVLMGFLGTALGMQHSIEGVRGLPPEQRYVFLIGLKESLCCLVDALTLVIPAALAAAWGSFRMARRLEDLASRG
jgi:hypothetical protein